MQLAFDVASDDFGLSVFLIFSLSLMMSLSRPKSTSADVTLPKLSW